MQIPYNTKGNVKITIGGGGKLVLPHTAFEAGDVVLRQVSTEYDNGLEIGNYFHVRTLIQILEAVLAEGEIDY